MAPKFVVSDFVSVSELDTEAVLMDMKQGRYYGLNEVGMQVYALLKEPRSVGEVVDALLDKYEVSREVLTEDVSRLLAELQERGLIREVDPA
ncbi:MAG: PqqD family protein [Bacteroidetes bacterium]|nr:MAG: PqqD family protein [Bacteroidota bacterium]